MLKLFSNLKVCLIGEWSIVGLANFHHSGSFSCTNSFSIFTNRQKQGLEHLPRLFGNTQPQPTCKGRIDLVEGQFRSLECGSPRFRRTRPNNRNRCLPQRVGSLMHGSNRRGEMVSPGTTPSYKLSGTVSRSICPQSIYKEQGSNAGSTVNGQHISSTLPQQKGRDQVPNSSLASKRSLGMVPRTSDCARSPAYPGNSKYRSKQRVPDLCGQQRLETCTPSIRQSKSGLGAPRGRPIFHPSVTTTSSLCELESKSRGRVSQCMGPRLEQIPRLRIPTVLLGGTLLKTSANTKCSNTGSNSSSVKNTTLVSAPLRTEHSTTTIATPYHGPINKATRRSPTDESPTSRVASIRQSYSATGISRSAQNLLLAAWRKGSSDSYSSAWGNLASWCSELKINPVCADIASILDFLTFEFDSGKAYRTLNIEL